MPAKVEVAPEAVAANKAPQKTTLAKSVVSNLTLGSADDALTLATELQRFVKLNGLTSKIQGKEFPNVEAWQFAGSLLGLSAMLESIEDKSDAQQIKWNATVRIISLATSTEVGRGFATCSNKESSKRGFADYAICSMAQTRAVGKAYRLSLGWLMKAAGYEATPFEEMSEVGTGATVVEPIALATPAPDKAGTDAQRNELRNLFTELDQASGPDAKRDARRAMLMSYSYNQLEQALAFYKKQLTDLVETGEVTS